MKKLLCLLPLLLLLCQPSLSQTVRVTDKTTLQPLEGVAVSGTSGTHSVRTDARGRVDVSPISSMDGRLHFTYVGYQTRTLTLPQLQQSAYDIALTQQSHNLNEVVISAGHFAEEQQLVPQEVEVISQRELNFMSQPTTADVMQQTGKVLVQKSQLGGGSPIIRGFEANKVLLVVDGARLNNAIYRGGHLQNIITLDNSMLERAEIIFGPSSVVYGSDALGGVLHFHTLQPQLADSSSGTFQWQCLYPLRNRCERENGSCSAKLRPPPLGQPDKHNSDRFW